MFHINFNYDIAIEELSKYETDLKNIANTVYTELNLKNDLFFDCSFVNIVEIQNINREYRNIDKPTDVISFALSEYDNKINLLGEIYICYEKIVQQAQEYNHSFKREIAFLFTHGLLHILGYDHMNKEEEEIMFGLQDKILDIVNIKR